MKNLYSIFNLNYDASLLDVCKAYQKKCMEMPSFIFYYTKILKIFINLFYKLFYDSLLFQVDIRLLMLFPKSLNEDDEYELAMIIFYMESLKDYIYDSKYFSSNKRYLLLLENWYDELENILISLKGYIQNFYLS